MAEEPKAPAKKTGPPQKTSDPGPRLDRREKSLERDRVEYTEQKKKDEKDTTRKK